MSDADKDNKNSERDPFDFFKLSSEPGNSNKGSDKKKPRIPFWGIMLIIVAVTAFINFFLMSRSDDLIPFSDFKAMVENGQIVSVDLGETYFTGYTSSSAESSDAGNFSLFSTGAARNTYKTAGILTESFLKLLDDKGITYKVVAKQGNFLMQLLLNLVVPFGFIFLMWFFFFRKMGGMGGGLGGSIFSAGASRASAVEEGQVTTRFADVAGVDEAKEELVEVVDFLKSPKKYTDIGGKIPKGVLLVGPPGTGKTLLARAVAGEANVPFFKISGSDFVEMFVGVGASRVRDLFKQAREKAPCIVFIDELDAIGKSRVNSINGNDEREQTLNQLLVEMDGFDNSKGLILLAATNRPDVLDPALLRPGRFDRQVVVDRPDVKGREAILKIHAKNVKLGNDVDLAAIARTTSGFAGADLANVVNEAALLAVRGGRKTVGMEDFDEAVEKAVAGLQKKSRVIKENERRIVAFHETGHALTAAFTDGADKVHKISIIPRGVAALGYTLQMPEEDRYLRTEKELYGEIDVLLGGRAAELIAFGEVSTGASNDLQRATDIARSILTDYGMSGRFRNVVLSQRGGGYGADSPQLIREYSESTQQYIDEELARIMAERFEHVTALLKEKRDVMEYIASRLLEKEIIDEAEFTDIIKAREHLDELQDRGQA
ncbi:ATP-dependent zinc metalloprotease FtsH [Treponema brennaborense]|uniref:ATP-dependent zinc metalloprotease FtsH n=1 Tax=Treponema brennaborense (strain DSM 12168 / CIP 105900 / DD5/3) TaxID=906968 RepID=F4LP66_TREBD|nr:ATP-dependent metalloprotease FtsH [Treponema brennaborense DSM 12168]